MMRRLLSTGVLLLCLPASQAGAIDIVVDYTYDTNNFFSTQESRDAMQAVADRFSTIITSNLAAVGPGGTGTGTGSGWRIGFSHPGTGASWEVSTAASQASDPLAPFFGQPNVGPADVYNFGGLNANEWILYAGGRNLTSAGVGGTGTGVNITDTFDDPNGPHHRGLIPVTGNSSGDLPTWGGAISFDTGRAWDFSLDSAGGEGSDFYTIALHEIGHALGLSGGWNQWDAWESGSTFTGPESLAAYNADNGTSRTWLNQVSSSNEHWEDGAYDSVIFAAGNPNYFGTVGAGNLQDLLMEPVANFTPSIHRLELTNVDVAALRDLGWETISISTDTPDLDGDGFVGASDLDLILAHWGGAGGTPALGDANGDNAVDNLDLNIVIGSWGEGTPPPGVVPEPGSLALLLLGGLAIVRRRRR